MSTPKLTKEQGIILTGFSGLLMCDFADFHGDVERRLGHPIFTHQLGDKEFCMKLREMYRKDFEDIMPENMK